MGVLNSETLKAISVVFKDEFNKSLKSTKQNMKKLQQ